MTKRAYCIRKYADIPLYRIEHGCMTRELWADRCPLFIIFFFRESIGKKFEIQIGTCLHIQLDFKLMSDYITSVNVSRILTDFRSNMEFLLLNQEYEWLYSPLIIIFL